MVSVLNDFCRSEYVRLGKHLPVPLAVSHLIQQVLYWETMCVVPSALTLVILIQISLL